MKALLKIEKAIDAICKFFTYVAALLSALLTLDVFLNVIFRAIGRPIVVSTELTTIIFPWIVCVAMIVVARKEENTALVLFFEKFKTPVNHIAYIFNNTVVLAFAILMAKSSLEISLPLINEYLPLTHLSKAATYGSVFIGFAGVCVVTIFNTVKYIFVNMVNSDKEGAKK